MLTDIEIAQAATPQPISAIAQKAGVPLVIASIEGTENVTKNVLRRPTRVTLKILEVIDAAEVKAEQTNSLADHSVETIQAAIA